MRNRWLIAGLIFAAACIAADYLVTRWAIDENPSGDGGRLYHFIHEDGDEIPIFGTSKVYYDYVPGEMGINAYNYGLDGSSYESTDTFLEIELAKHKRTPIIIDLKPQSEYGIGDPAAYVPFVTDSRVRELLARTHSLDWRYYVPGLRYFGYYDEYLKEMINDRMHAVRRVDRGFSYEKNWTFDRNRLDAAISKRIRAPNGYFADEEQNARLIRRIEAHPERLFFLVYSPVHDSCFTNFQNADAFERFKMRLAALPNAIVLDFQRPSYPDAWFMDTNHLLFPGAEDFSRRLGALVRAVAASRGIMLAAQ